MLRRNPGNKDLLCWLEGIDVSQHSEQHIRLLNAEAETHEAEAKRFSEWASYVNADQHKKELEVLADKARQKATEIRGRIQRMRNAKQN